MDPVGGAYCLIERSRAVELPPPFRVALTRGPVFQEVVQVRTTYVWLCLDTCHMFCRTLGTAVVKPFKLVKLVKHG